MSVLDWKEKERKGVLRLDCVLSAIEPNRISLIMHLIIMLMGFQGPVGRI